MAKDTCERCGGSGYETLLGSGGFAQGPCGGCRPLAAAGQIEPDRLAAVGLQPAAPPADEET